jgi:hypothetical protein
MNGRQRRRLDLLTQTHAPCFGCLDKAIHRAGFDADDRYRRFREDLRDYLATHGGVPESSPLLDPLPPESTSERRARKQAKARLERLMAQKRSLESSVPPSKRRESCPRCATFQKCAAVAARVSANNARRLAEEEEDRLSEAESEK